MKRVVEFKALGENYAFVEEDNVIFSINQKDLQFDVKSFYKGFFANQLDYSEIELHGAENMDKTAMHVLNTVQQLLSEICNRLKDEQ